MSGRHSRSANNERRSESEAASIEIVAIRSKLSEIEMGLESLPAGATEALVTLEQRKLELEAKMAELQDLFTDHGDREISSPEDAPPPDRTLIPPM